MRCLWGDKRVKVSEPDRATKHYESVEVNIVSSAKVKTHGTYLTKSGKPRGLIVHYTAGRSEGNGHAVNTLKYLGRHGLGCMTMSRNGAVFRAKSQSYNQVAWHAGTSSYHGVTGMSRYCAGMEICNAGKLTRVSTNAYKAWFGEHYTLPDVRERDGDFYHKYSEAQELALFNYCMQELETNDEFRIDWVLGHVEIAPKRKTDPGGSLSMPMPEFRECLNRGRF